MLEWARCDFKMILKLCSVFNSTKQETENKNINIYENLIFNINKLVKKLFKNDYSKYNPQIRHL